MSVSATSTAAANTQHRAGRASSPIHSATAATIRTTVRKRSAARWSVPPSEEPSRPPERASEARTAPSTAQVTTARSLYAPALVTESPSGSRPRTAAAANSSARWVSRDMPASCPANAPSNGFLQLAADAVGDRPGDRRGDERGDAEEPHLPLVREAEGHQEAVPGPGEEGHADPHEEGDADRRAQGVVARAVEEMVGPPVAGDEALLEPRPRIERQEADGREQQ